MVYVTSDLHGYSLGKFRQKLNEIGFSEEDTLYILGDCVDRGKDGISLLKWIFSERNVELILGNHEDMLLNCSFLFVPPKKQITDSSETMSAYFEWMINGGSQTNQALQEFDEKECIELFDNLRQCPLYKKITVKNKKYLLVHSGLGNFSKNKKLDDYTKEELLWSRPDADTEYFDDITVIFGHTPTEYFGDQYKGRMLKTKTWIDIDTGTASPSPMILRLDDMKEFYFKNDDELSSVAV